MPFQWPAVSGLWQPSFHDRVLRDDESDLHVLRYILWNPVRAGLVERPEDYPFLGSTTHSVSEIVRMCETFVPATSAATVKTFP